MRKKLAYGYAPELALSGEKVSLPSIEAWPNQHRGYEIRIEFPEFTSMCPKTHLPDFGNLVLEYEPDKLCVELKSFKYYLLAYRDVGIFCENSVSRVLGDVVKAVKPVWAEMTGSFTARGGMRSTITARFGKRRIAAY